MGLAASRHCRQAALPSRRRRLDLLRHRQERRRQAGDALVPPCFRLRRRSCWHQLIGEDWAMLTIDCPQCSKKLKAPESTIGKPVKCACGHLFIAAAPSFEPEPPPFRSPAVRGQGDPGRRIVGFYSTAVGLAVVASVLTTAITSILLREPKSEPVPSVPQPIAAEQQVVRDERVPELESRLTEIAKRLDEQKQTIDRL